MRCPHTHFTTGKRVRVKLRDGTVFFDKFMERRGRYIELKERGSVPTRSIVVMSIAR